MTLPNLAALADKATPSFPNRWQSGETEPPTVRVLAPAGVWVGIPYDEHDAALIAAAPEMAELLIECEQALKAIKERTEDYPVRPTYACLDATELAAAALARLADFDRGIG